MAEPDLLGFNDCSPTFAEGPVDTAEHIRQTAYHAISTQRGQDDEEPDRWADIWSLLEQSVSALAEAAIVNSGTDLEETDSRIVKAVYRLLPGAARDWIAEITTRSGAVTAEGTLQPLPQDDLPPDGEPISPPVVSSGRTIRQGALEGGWFPFWLLGPNGGKIVYTFALVLDTQLEWLTQGIQQRFPLLCESGALPWLGRDLGITRGRYETESSYRMRLSKWAPTHRRAGTPFAITEQVQAAMFPDVPRVHVIQHDPAVGGPSTRATWSTRHPDGSETTSVIAPSTWDVDSNDPSRPVSLDSRDPRIWILIEQPSSDAARLFAPRSSAQAVARDLLGSNGIVSPSGARVPADQYLDYYDLAQKWRAMGAFVAGVFVIFGEADIDGTGSLAPDGSWHDVLNDAKDGNRIPTEYRIMYMNRYPGNRLPASPAPYTV